VPENSSKLNPSKTRGIWRLLQPVLFDKDLLGRVGRILFLAFFVFYTLKPALIPVAARPGVQSLRFFNDCRFYLPLFQ
jgi:hypothetical protein